MNTRVWVTRWPWLARVLALLLIPASALLCAATGAYEGIRYNCEAADLWHLFRTGKVR